MVFVIRVKLLFIQMKIKDINKPFVIFGRESKERHSWLQSAALLKRIILRIQHKVNGFETVKLKIK